MTAMNRVFLAGNLTRDPVLRQTTGGQAVADLGIAVTDTFTNRNGEKVETTCFADIVAWGRLAETCNQYLGKGSPILLEGRLELDAWQTEQGEKRNKLRVRADRVQFLGRPRTGNENGQAGGGAKAGRKPVPAGRAGDDEKVDF
ncbi:single-stranded DNA-binding protein [bacterium]|nr:single-stranded DNA-binding protein [bacterium]